MGQFVGEEIAFIRDGYLLCLQQTWCRTFTILIDQKKENVLQITQSLSKNVEYFEQRPAGDSSSGFKARSSEIDSGSSQHVPVLRSKHQGEVGSNWTENISVKNIWMKNISHWDLWCRLQAGCSHQFWRCVDQGNHLLLQWSEDLWSEFSESRACTHRPWFHYLKKDIYKAYFGGNCMLQKLRIT